MAKNDKTAAEKNDKTAAEKKAMFEAYAKADASHIASKASMETSYDARSKAVKAIHDACGVGPFQYKGRILTVVKRMKGTEKDDEGNIVKGSGTESYYFKSPSQSEVQDIG